MLNECRNRGEILVIDDRIKTRNLKKDMRKLIEPFLERLKEREEILAILLLGGLSDNNIRSHLDEFSDIDISIFVKSRESIPACIPNYEFYMFDKDDKKIEINVHQMILELEKEIIWDEGKKEAYMHAEYYFERNNEPRNLIDSKIMFDENYRKNRLALIIGQYRWYVEINPLRAIKRGFYINAIDLLNKGIEMFYEALYLINREYQPHNKWRFEASCDLRWIPNNYREKMEMAVLTSNITESAILQKRKYIMELFKDLIERINSEMEEEIDYYHFACINSYTDRQIVDSTYADKLYDKVRNVISEEEKVFLYSLINSELISSDEELKKVCIQQYNENICKVYNKIRSEI